MTTKTRCLAVDDHPTVRQGLGLMFGLAPDLELVGSVENGEDVIEAVRVAVGMGRDIARPTTADVEAAAGRAVEWVGPRTWSKP